MVHGACAAHRAYRARFGLGADPGRPLLKTRLFFLATPLVLAAWLGCNALLGNEDAVFAPDAGPSTPDASDAGTGLDATTDTDADAASEDAGPPCVDTTANPKHCGACGHDCLGGLCVASQCQPVVLATDVGDTAIGGPTAIALSPTHVFWTNSSTGDIRRVPIAGGMSEVVFDGPPNTAPGDGIAIVGDTIYFPLPDGSAIVSCPVTGCGVAVPTIVIPGLTSANFVGRTGDRLVFTETRPSGRVGTCTLPCTSQQVVTATAGRPLHAAATTDALVWSTLIAPPETPTPGALYVQRPAQDAAPLAQGIPAVGVLIVDDQVIFGDRARGLVAVPLDGGAQRRLALTNTDSAYLAYDGTTLVFPHSTASGAILRCPPSGCGDAGAPVAQGQPYPRGVAVDAKSIYWVNEGSSGNAAVMRVAK